MEKNIKLLLSGFFVWLVPFVVSWGLYSPEGVPLFDLHVIKSVLIVIGSLLGAYLMLEYFKGIRKDFVKEGVMVGVSWLLISSVLDIIFLVYVLKGMDAATWFGQVGLRYMIMPIMSVSMGKAIEMQKK